MQIVENRELLLRLRNPKRVTDVVKDTKSLQDGKVLVHWNLENAQKLTEMEVKVESPIIRDYKFTGMFDHFYHYAGEHFALTSRVQVKLLVQYGRVIIL
jgi:hypothetical protein